MGTITATAVLPDAKTRIYGFTGASFNDGTPTPPAGPPPGDCCGNDGDPVNLTTGIFTPEMTDLVVSDVLPLVFTRTYNSQDPYARPFGIGMRHSFGLFMHSEVWHSEADLYLPDGGKIHFARISDPSLPVEETVFEHTATPTAFYKATMTFWGEPIGDHGWNVTLKDGTVYVFPHAGSPLQAIRDRHGNEIRLTWASGNLQRITSPNGRWLAFTYGTGGRVSQVSDNIGRTVGYTYDASGRLSTVTDPEQHVTSYTWDANNRMTGVRPPNLQGTQTNLVTNEYTTAADAPTPVGWVKRQTHADGGVYQFTYTVSNGKSTQTQVTDPRGYVRRVTFNTDGYALEDRRALNQPEEQHDTSDRPIQGNFITSHTNTHGDVTTTEYDELGRVTRVIRLPGTADEAITTYTYDPVWPSEIATITDPLNHTTTFTYDERGNRETVTDALNHSTTFEYNLAGQVTFVTDPLQHTTTFEYAGPDLVKVTDPLGRVTQRFYDAAGRLVAETDPAGQTTRFAYDKLNQVTQVTDPLGGITTNGYDTAGRLGSVTDALNHATTFGYDAFNRLASRTDPLSKTETFTYDLNGNPSQRIDRKGQITTRSYDALNRLHQITDDDDSTVTYTYDSGNRVTTIVDSVSGTITRDYDDLDRLISETTAQGSISYTYDKANRRATMTVAGQPTVTYGYDDANRLTTVTQDASTVTLTYDEADRRSTLTLPNGIQVAYGYDDGSQIAELTYTVGQSPLGTLTYGYDLAGRRTEIGGTWARTGLPQPIASTDYDPANRLTMWAGSAFSYDPNGNLTSDGLTSYSWNARNQLTGLSGETSASFTYDAFGRRRGKSTGGTTTNFLYDRIVLVQELSGTTPTVNLLTGLRIDEIWSRADASGTRTKLADALQSMVADADSGGTVLTQFTYEPFGATQTPGSPITDAFLYTGRERDYVNLYYYRARYYIPQLGRFLSEDPAGLVDGPNMYAYALNNPVNNTDPAGLKVTNNSDCVVYVKPELTGDAIPLTAGAVYPGKQDGVAVPKSHPGEVYKSTDGIDLTINKDGSVTPAGGRLDLLLNYFRGGWKDKAWNDGLHKAGDTGWDALFTASARKPECDKKMACAW